MQVNHKRVLQMMRKDNLLALRRRRFVVTTHSNHRFDVYLNLARRMKLSGTDQLWVADITLYSSRRHNAKETHGKEPSKSNFRSASL
jgi:transposase InsO family protein